MEYKLNLIYLHIVMEIIIMFYIVIMIIDVIYVLSTSLAYVTCSINGEYYNFIIGNKRTSLILCCSLHSINLE